MFICKICKTEFENKYAYMGHVSGHKRIDSGYNLGLTTSNCINCQEEIKFYIGNSAGKYCSNKCQTEYQYKNDTLIRFYKGEVSVRQTLRIILGKEIKEECFECGIKEWNNKSLILEVDHINGNAANNMPDNLRLLCPNCHSQTDTSCGKNFGKGRKSRGLKPN